VLPLLLFLYQITRLLVPFIGRCNHENKIFGALRMLLVRPSAMLIIQINALIYRCYSTKKKKKKPLEGSLSPQLVSRNDPST
jgi:hypothetical protein